MPIRVPPPGYVRPEVQMEKSRAPAAQRYREAAQWLQGVAVFGVAYQLLIAFYDLQLPNGWYISRPSVLRAAAAASDPPLQEPYATLFEHYTPATLLAFVLPYLLGFVAVMPSVRSKAALALFALHQFALLGVYTWTWWVPFANPDVGPWYSSDAMLQLYRTGYQDTYRLIMRWDLNATEIVPDLNQMALWIFAMIGLSAAADVGVHWGVGQDYLDGKVQAADEIGEQETSVAESAKDTNKVLDTPDSPAERKQTKSKGSNRKKAKQE
ncbi:hypothetical protein RI367_006099 [Sorochytrium milnesiophthora]